MSHTIFVESRELSDASNRMANIIRSMTEIQRVIGTINNNAASRWQGRAAEQNTENFQALNNLTTNYLVDAGGTQSALTAAIATYDRTESNQVTSVAQLGTEGIFSGR